MTVLILIINPGFTPQDQHKSYDQLWKEIEASADKGLPKSALQTLDIVHQKALTEKNSPQLLKATLFRFSMMQTFEENHLLKSIDYTRDLMPLLQSPAREVLHSVMAELYWFYYQQNKTLFLERTDLAIPSSDDIRTWDLSTLRNTISNHYDLSLRAQNLMDTVLLQKYEPILLFASKEAFLLQPTLFDFILSRALQYYSNNDAALKEVISSASMKNVSLWQPAAAFTTLHLPQSDHQQDITLLLFQKLLLSNLKQKHFEALIANEVKRYQFLRYQYAGTESVDSLYFDALSSLQKRYDAYPGSAEVASLRATLLIEKSMNAEENESNKIKNIGLALEICDEAIRAFPGSSGATMCMIQRQQVLQKEISVNIQRVELPDKPIPALLSYRNITKPTFRILRLSSEKLEKIMNLVEQEERLSAFLKIQALHQWQIELPFEADYASHSTIIDIPKLSKGLYVMLVAESDVFSPGGIISFTSFQVSRLSFVSLKRNDANLFYLLDRDSGKPVKGATIRVMTRDYDYNSRKYNTQERMLVRSGSDGSFSVTPTNQIPKNAAFYIEVMTKNDTLYNDNYFDLYVRKTNTRKQTKTWFFTDRAIYRPGQTVYFKGITLEKEGDSEWTIKEKYNSLVKFFDVNSREVATLQLKTNDFGSFEGSFTTPSGMLNGMMRISNEHGSTMFSVEEYKRPTFEVFLEAADKQFRLNDTITIKGEAKAFAGFGLDSVAITYRIEREKFYPYWPWWRGFPPISQRKILIAEGKSYTKTDGSFAILFNTTPEPGSSIQQQSFYSYIVTVDVIDRNGETRSATKNIRVGEVALLLTTNLEKVISKNDIDRFKLMAANLQEKAVNTQAELKFYRLKTPDKLSRPSLWPQPDRNFLSKEKLYELFPLDNFDGNQKPESREKTLVFSQSSFIIGSKTLFPDEVSQWMDGEYLLEVTAKDDFEQEIKLQEIFTFYDQKNKTLPVNELSWFHLNKNSSEPGDTVMFYLGSATQGNRVLVEVMNGKEVLYSHWHNLSNRKLVLPFIVKEEHRGSLSFQAVFVKHNRLLQTAIDLEVPFTNKMLDISLVTKRDKLSPGAKETWTLNVRGKNKDKAAAELLASMYDASLDQFRRHNWAFNPIERITYAPRWASDNGFLTYTTTQITRYPDFDFQYNPTNEIQLNWFGLQPSFRFGNGIMRGNPMMTKSSHQEMDEVAFAAVIEDNDSMQNDEGISGKPETATNATTPATMLRSNFRETAFFYPQLQSDSNGNVSFSFQLPDALTRWNLLLLAHTKDLKTGLKTLSFTASKDLMMMPNTPRFYREGDTAWVAAKVVNFSKEIMNGIARLDISDPITGNQLAYFPENQIQKPFLNLKPGQSTEVRWKVVIGDTSSLLAFRFSASGGVFTDSEERIVPVLPSKVMLTETMPMHISGGSSRKYVFKNLKETGKNEQNHLLKLQFNSNPAWYAVQALPYIYESGSENADNIFNRYYANALAAQIAKTIPQVMRVVDAWRIEGSTALVSNLEKNEELKAVILAETPWVLEAADETQQKKNIALLFDLNRMQYEQQQAITKLRALQLSDGSWPWFPGMHGSRYITLNILSGAGKLQHLGAIGDNEQMHSMISKALLYLDLQIVSDYEKMLKDKQDLYYTLHAGHLNYLYARSFFPEKEMNEKTVIAYNFYLGHVKSDWLKLNNGMQAMAALTLHRNNQSEHAKAILASLHERALSNEELGTYWKQEQGFYWYQAPVENQALIITAFDEIANDTAWIDAMRVWLLSQKRTNKWETGRATAEAVYALLLRGSDWIAESKAVEIKVGNEIITVEPSETGTGLVTKDWFGSEISSSLAEVELTNPNKVMAWGAMFRQYFVPADQVKANQTQLRISRELFVERIGKKGILLVPVQKTIVKVGERIKVRLILESDRDMEFVHLKDQRAAALEPKDVISGYQYNFGLGYYQSTRDASTDFFFNYLPKGKYVFEYSLVTMQSGDFTNGYAQIQSFYAPEFSSHSEGIRFKVVE